MATSMVRVLVVDDERMISWSMEQTLKAAGYEVVTANTVEGGMALFRALHPDVVFLDVRLPDGDGLSMLKRLRDEGVPETAVIVMTAYDETCTADAALSQGASAYLKKPFDFEALPALVGRTKGSSRV